MSSLDYIDTKTCIFSKRWQYEREKKFDRGWETMKIPISNELPEILSDWVNYKSGNTEFKKAFPVKKSEMINNFSPEKIVIYSNNTDWEIKTLHELCIDIFTGRTPARDQYTNKGYKILKVRDLTGKGIDWDNHERAFISEKIFQKTKHLQLQENDILFITAAHHPKYIGQKIDVLDSIPGRYRNGVLCTTELMVLRVNPNIIDPYYVSLFLKTKDGYRAIQSCIRGQTAHIYPKDIKNIKIPIPPKKEFEKIIKEIESLKKSLSKKIQANEEYIESYDKLIQLMEAVD